MAFTFFFRDSHTLKNLSGKIYEYHKDKADIKVWDAGCAMGPEPYTFAIILNEEFGSDFNKLAITATDIDESGNFGDIVNAGQYPYSALKRIPEEILAKYFTKTDNENYIINDNIRKKVNYAWHDLLTYKPYGSRYSAVLCKNVLLHFLYEQRVEVIKMFHSVLEKDGLFATEQTQALPAESENLFEKITSDANIYKKM